MGLVLKGRICLHKWKDRVTRNVHVQYENSNTSYLEVMINVIFKKKIGQTPRSNGYGILM